MADEREVLLEVKDLEVTYGSGRKAYKAVKNANFTIYKGETFGLVGESGSGKTTIGRAIMRILPTSGGQVLYKGQQINGKISHALDRQVIKEMQMIFQDPQSSLNERAKVSYIVGEGLMNVRPDLSAAERDEKVRQALLDVGLLPEFASRFPHEFSGGQRQRIGIARALIMEPEFIIADEPISALDVSIRAQVLNLMAELQRRRGLTYLLISHDLSVMRFICDRIAVMDGGRVVEQGETYEVFSNPQSEMLRGLVRHSQNFALPSGAFEQNGSIIKLTYAGENATEPVLFDAGKLFDVRLSILHGKIEYINEKPFGILYVRAEGANDQIDRATAHLRGQVEHLEVLKHAG